jgi:hypothetical protein
MTKSAKRYLADIPDMAAEMGLRVVELEAGSAKFFKRIIRSPGRRPTFPGAAFRR